ncbi:MAG: DUF1732 domain-containing protein, partial [Lentisphaerae bacterium]|nr:DUF1732 domain-containing protein [Lentisphaerota bacterium]
TRAVQVLAQCRNLARRMHLKDDLTAAHLLMIPDLWRSATPDAALPVIQEPARRAVRLALAALDKMRRAEGSQLGGDLARRLRFLESQVQRIERRAPRAALRLRRQLLARIKELDLPSRPDPVRLEREIAVCITRGDISEELVRLRSHCSQFAQLAGTGRPAGRTLDFLIQEMLREVNTIGSKAGDTDIVRRVVALKAELERIREQVQNVE